MFVRCLKNVAMLRKRIKGERQMEFFFVRFTEKRTRIWEIHPKAAHLCYLPDSSLAFSFGSPFCFRIDFK